MARRWRPWRARDVLSPKMPARPLKGEYSTAPMPPAEKPRCNPGARDSLSPEKRRGIKAPALRRVFLAEVGARSSGLAALPRGFKVQTMHCPESHGFAIPPPVRARVCH
jgi:hypothetical protein